MQVATAVPPKYLQHVRAPSANGIGLYGTLGSGTSPWGIAWGLLSLGSTAVSAYHGYKRNDSIGWGVAWGVLGGLFPVITPAIAAAQGIGKRKAR